MTLWMVRTYISLSLHMCSLVFGIKGISTNISGSISLPNFLSDTVLKLQVTQPSPDSVSPHLSEVTILCFVSPFLLYILHPGLQDHHRVLCICFPSVKEQNRMMPFCWMTENTVLHILFTFLLVYRGRAFPVVFTPSWPEVEVLSYIEIYKIQMWIHKGC